MSMMKTSLTTIPMCPRERFPLYKSLSRLVLCYKKNWAILLHLIYFYYVLLVTNYLITKLAITDNFSACREYLAENCISFPSAPRWVRNSYLLKSYDRSPTLVGHQPLPQVPHCNRLWRLCTSPAKQMESYFISNACSRCFQASQEILLLHSVPGSIVVQTLPQLPCKNL